MPVAFDSKSKFRITVLIASNKLGNLGLHVVGVPKCPKCLCFLGANNQTANLLAAVGCNCVPIVDVRVFVQKQIDEAGPVGWLKR